MNPNNTDSNRDDRLLAAHLRGYGVGLLGGYFARWWLEDELMYGVALLAIASVLLGWVIDSWAVDSDMAHSSE